MPINQTSDVMMNNQLDRKQVKYLSKDFSDFKRNLIEFTKFYFADTYQDFSDASPGSIFLDLSSYIGDVLSYYTDHSFKENLLAHAEEMENIVSLAQGFGYKPRAVTPAFCTVSMSALIPADPSATTNSFSVATASPSRNMSACDAWWTMCGRNGVSSMATTFACVGLSLGGYHGARQRMVRIRSASSRIAPDARSSLRMASRTWS